MKRLHNQLLARLDVVEDLLSEYEKASIDPNIGFPHALDAFYRIARLKLYNMEALRGLRAQEAGNLPALGNAVDQFGKRAIGQAIRVIGEEHVLALEIFLDRLQTLADVRREPRIDECDPPVGDVALLQLYVLSTITHRKVVGEVFLVVEKIILDRIGLVPKTEDEILVAEMGVILHYVPQDGAVSDLHQRLGNVFREISQPRPQTAAEQHDFHWRVPRQH